jgi:hypothetical protein
VLPACGMAFMRHRKEGYFTWWAKDVKSDHGLGTTKISVQWQVTAVGYSTFKSFMWLDTNYSYAPFLSIFYSSTVLGKLKLSLCTQRRRMCEWSYSSFVLNLDNRWRRKFSFVRRPLYLREQNLRYPFTVRLSGP